MLDQSLMKLYLFPEVQESVLSPRTEQSPGPTVLLVAPLQPRTPKAKQSKAKQSKAKHWKFEIAEVI